MKWWCSCWSLHLSSGAALGFPIVSGVTFHKSDEESRFLCINSSIQVVGRSGEDGFLSICVEGLYCITSYFIY